MRKEGLRSLLSWSGRDHQLKSWGPVHLKDKYFPGDNYYNRTTILHFFCTSLSFVLNRIAQLGGAIHGAHISPRSLHLWHHSALGNATYAARILFYSKGLLPCFLVPYLVQLKNGSDSFISLYISLDTKFLFKASVSYQPLSPRSGYPSAPIKFDHI